jgi:hypothetical protein
VYFILGRENGRWHVKGLDAVLGVESIKSGRWFLLFSC